MTGETTLPLSSEPSTATLLSFLSCASGGMSFLILHHGEKLPLPILIFVLFPWLVGAGVTLVIRSTAWQRAWMTCTGLLAMANMAMVAACVLTDDLVLRLASSALPLFNICGITAGFGISWLIAVMLDDPAKAGTPGGTVTSRTPPVSAESVDDQTANSESRPDPGHSAP